MATVNTDKREATRQLLKRLFAVRVFESLAESWAAGENEPLGYPYAYWDETADAYWLVNGREESLWFKPCDDIAAAWQIKKRMRELDWSCHAHSGPADQPYVSVSFRKPSEPIQWAEEMDADKEAEAICLAALRALGIPEGGV